MYVRKFEADSLEEALKEVKGELGPDAIILKTATHKGLKGAFKRKRVEITAAISEKNYVKKANVDHALGDNFKEKFYQNSSSYISNMINDYSSNKETQQTGSKMSGYANLGLNKTVNTTKKEEVVNSGLSLDSFLKEGSSHSQQNEEGPGLFDGYQKQVLDSKLSEPTQNIIEPMISEPVITQKETPAQQRVSANENFSEKVIHEQQLKIDKLERALFELGESFKKFEKPESIGIRALRHSLKSLDVSEEYMQEVIKKACFELSETDLDDADVVFEFALRNMTEQIKTELPMFSSTDLDQESVITVFISETSCGQTTLAKKIATLTENSTVIQFGTDENTGKGSFSDKMLNLEIQSVNSIAECVSAVRKATDKNNNVFIDYKGLDSQTEETKKFIDGLKRSFEKVEVLVALSGIHSELYNKKVVSRYQNLAQGMVVSNLDMCLNFGSLFNLGHAYKNVPFKFFGNGAMIPDDIEAATVERILAGIFNL